MEYVDINSQDRMASHICGSVPQKQSLSCFVQSALHLLRRPSGSRNSRLCESTCSPSMHRRQYRSGRAQFHMTTRGSDEYANKNKKSTSSSWRDQVRMLLDPTLTISAKSVLAQDMAKRAPEISKEAFEDVCNTAGLEGVPAVVNQVTNDILPDLAKNGPRYVSEFSRRLPEIVNEATANVQKGMQDYTSSARPASGDFVNSVNQEIRNMFSRTPEGLETPTFEVVERRDGYDLRQYPDILVANTQMQRPMDSSGSELDVASAMGNSFNVLAKYLFGKNTSGAAMAMTTPVIMEQRADNSGSMSFIVPSKFGSDLNAVPQPVAPVADSVEISQRRGGLYAVATFTGYATAGEVSRQRMSLLNALRRDGVSPALRDSADPSCSIYSVFVYNGPWTVAFMRRNEICIKIESAVQTSSTASVPDITSLQSEGSYDSVDSITD